MVSVMQGLVVLLLGLFALANTSDGGWQQNENFVTFRSQIKVWNCWDSFHPYKLMLRMMNLSW